MPGITVNTNLQIIYSPRGTGAAVQTFQLKSQHGAQPSRFDDGPEWFKQTTITEGGAVVTIIHDLFYVVTIRIEAVFISHDLPGSPLWAELQNWWLHAGSGGLFNVSLSRERVGPFTLATGALQGVTSIDPGADPTTGPSTTVENDTLMFEDADDPSLTEYVIADADATTGPNSITFKPALMRDYANGSKLRFADSYEDCYALQPTHPLKRRAAKAGPFMWDFQLKFRTTRP